MISKLIITDSTKTPVKWWSKNKTLASIKEMVFAPGLNIIWGKNGSGKSSALKLMSSMFHAEQGRYSVITSTSCSELFDMGKALPSGIEFKHDGQGIAYYDPHATPGLIGGMAGFDYDFTKEGISSIFTKGSSGELVINEIGKILKKLDSKKTLEPSYNVQKGSRVSLVKEFFKPNIEQGQITILLDEPDRSLDITNQLLMWEGFPRLSRKYQFIIASHSLFAANIKNANYIELNNGYLGQCRNAIKKINFTDEIKTNVVERQEILDSTSKDNSDLPKEVPITKKISI